MQILDHERRIMPPAMRAHLAEFEREAEAWRRRQASDLRIKSGDRDAAAGSHLPADGKPVGARDDTPPASDTRRISTRSASAGEARRTRALVAMGFPRQSVGKMTRLSRDKDLRAERPA
jgi:hypothetical protein